jgi:L-rhamnose isomerase
VGGFDSPAALSGGIQTTGNYPGKARTPDELMADLDKAFSLIPGKKKLNIHACYAIFEEGEYADRDAIAPKHFAKWLAFAKERGMGIDFNPTFFAHPMVKDNLTLSSPDRATRDFWVKTGIGGREIAAAIGRELGTTCIHNHWIPDGMKDVPADRRLYRDLLEESLDRIFEKKYDKALTRDTLEGKLFAVGVESFTVGSHEFYYGYAVKNGIGVCMDSGHYHPTEGVADKLTAAARSLPTLLLHLSRGVRWDSDHVLLTGEELTATMREVVRSGLAENENFFMSLDYFDASINRIAAWAIGLRSAGFSLLSAMLEPFPILQKAELAGDFTARLALHEEFSRLPAAAVWDYLCLREGKPVGLSWLDAVRRYEAEVTSKR